MPFHIRHGAPGSYKSACAVWLDCLEWLKQGRKVHTNIRGIGDVADFEMAFGVELPESAEVIPYDVRTRAEKQQFAAWFHWLPLGDAIIIDEGQMIYPNRKEFKPESLDLADELNPIIPETGERERPSDIFQAIDMHRHYNWDGCVTTPNIKKLPDWFRGSVEVAYKHDNRSHIPWDKGKTRIITHAPDTSVPALAKGVPVKTLKVNKNVFKVYGSTTTGEITKNVSRKNPLKSPALYFPLIVAVLGVFWFVKTLAGMLSDDPPAPEMAVQENSAPARDPGDYRRHLKDAPSRPPEPAGPDASLSAFQLLARYLPGANGLFVVGSFGPSGGPTQYMYALVTPDRHVTVPARWLADAGFTVEVQSECAHDITHPLASSTLRVLCRPVTRTERSEASVASEAEPAEFSPMSSINPLGFSMTNAN